MSSLGRPGHGSRGRGGGEEYEGESSEKDKNKKRKIGRPPNKPPPPPRQIPFKLVPRPSPEGQGDQRQRHSPERRSAGRVTNQATSQHEAHTPTRNTDRPRRPSSNRSSSPRPRPSRRNRVPRRLSENIAFDECLTRVKVLNRQGDHWAALPALISPHWRQSTFHMEAAEALGHSPTRLKSWERRTALTPRGLATYEEAVVLWIEPETLGLPAHLIRLPIMNEHNLGVSIILGRDYIEACYGRNNWPPREDTQYVAPDTMLPPIATYSMDLAASAHGNYYVDEGIGPTIDTNNVNPAMANAGIDYDLLAVGAGIGSYDEIPSGDFTSWDG